VRTHVTAARESATGTRQKVSSRVRRTAGGAAREAGWHLAVPVLRRQARHRLPVLEPGAVTVVTVNWNSWEYLVVLLDVVGRRSPDTRILIVDNGSSDGSPDRLRQRLDIERLLLPVNLGHDLALDLGVLRCSTEYVVTLDVDAFPLRDDWLDQLLQPLQQGAQIYGARLWRPFVHPCCLAMRTSHFVEQEHSFRSRYWVTPGTEDSRHDVGEDMLGRPSALHFFTITSQRGPGDVGPVFDDLVHHNFYATRFASVSHLKFAG